LPSPQQTLLPKGATRLTVQALGSQIVAGRWTPETRLPHEQDLAAAFGVGRNVLREAVKVLAGKGLIRTARRYGSCVCKKSEWNFFDADVLSWHLSDRDQYARFLHDLTELRLCIEPRAAALAARRATSEERARLVALTDALETASALDAVAVDVEFHLAILDATHNELIAGFRQPFSVLLNALFEATRVSLSGKYAYDWNPVIHRALAVAIRDGREEEAYALVFAMQARNHTGATDLAASQGEWWIGPPAGDRRPEAPSGGSRDRTNPSRLKRAPKITRPRSS
jgi:GntR family transcriptional regulator, galactonate operon transcriptional repressor